MTKAGKSLRAIDTPFFRYWQALYLSFFSSKLYLDVAKRWKGFGFIYLFLVLMIFSLPFSLRLIVEFNQFFNEQVIQPLRELPPLYVQNGSLSFDKPMPYFIKNSKGQVVTIVDTTGTINSIDETYPNLSILITKDKLLYRILTPPLFFKTDTKPNAESKIEVFPFKDQSSSVFVGKDWLKSSGVRTLILFANFLIYPVILLLSFGVLLTLIMTFALMGQFIAKLFFDVSISYMQSCRLLIVSMTPVLLALWIVMTLGYGASPYVYLIPILLIVYFCYAVICVKWQSKKLVHS